MYCRLDKLHVLSRLEGRPAATYHDTYLSCHTSRPRLTSESPQIVTLLACWEHGGANTGRPRRWKRHGTWLLCRRTRGLWWEAQGWSAALHLRQSSSRPRVTPAVLFSRCACQLAPGPTKRLLIGGPLNWSHGRPWLQFSLFLSTASLPRQAINWIYISQGRRMVICHVLV